MHGAHNVSESLGGNEWGIHVPCVSNRSCDSQNDYFSLALVLYSLASLDIYHYDDRLVLLTATLQSATVLYSHPTTTHWCASCFDLQRTFQDMKENVKS